VEALEGEFALAAAALRREADTVIHVLPLFLLYFILSSCAASRTMHLYELNDVTNSMVSNIEKYHTQLKRWGTQVRSSDFLLQSTPVSGKCFRNGTIF
jgi:hypothetical protein